MNIAVYLASSFGKSKEIQKKTIELAQYIGKNHHTLVYGGSNCGLMGLLADNVLATEGHIIGVEPKFFHDDGYTYTGLSKLILVDTMAERKAKMMELSNAFVALPGGLGTLDEITEILDINKRAIPHRHIFFYNIEGFYEPTKLQIEKMVEYGYLPRDYFERIHFIQNIEEFDEIIKTEA